MRFWLEECVPRDSGAVDCRPRPLRDHGFAWWQGHKGTGSAAHASKYEENWERLIDSLRKDWDAPQAKFVLATGCGNPGRDGLGLKIAEAQFAVGDAKKYKPFVGNVTAVDSRDLWREAADSPKNQGYHDNRNAETDVETGLRLGGRWQNC